MNIRQLFFLFAFSNFAISASAQFEVDVQLRPRYEFRNGYKQFRTADTKASNFVSQQSRIRFAYQKDNLELKLSFQDVHVWGDIGPKQIEEGLVGVHEAWAKFRFKNNVFIVIGRQELSYDNKRILSDANWNQVGFTHDAVKIGYLTDKWQIETAFGYNQSGKVFGNDYFPDFSYYKAMNTLWISRKYDKLSFSLINLADVRQKNDSVNIDYLRNTGGPVISYKSDKLAFDFRAFYQFGKLQSGQDVSAYFMNADVGYNLIEKTKLGLGFELLSGNNALDSTSNTNKAFDIMYGTRHKFNGLMDYFNIPGTTGGAGLVDLYAKIEFKASEKVTVKADWHHFRHQNNYVDAANNKADRFLGNELDLSANIKFNKSVQLYLAYCMMFGGETLELIKGGDKDLFNSYGIVMLTIKPTLFKQEKI